MRGMKWNTLAFLTVSGLILGACAGGEDADEGAPADAPAAQPGATADPGAAAPSQQTPALAQGVTQEQFDQGRQLFTGQGGCQACHGPQARGTQLAPDLTDDEWLNVTDPSLETVGQLIRTGVAEPKEHPAPMPPMGGANLSDDQVRALAGYVLSIAGS